MTDLTQAAKDLLKTVQFRADLGQTWLVLDQANRYGLVVPTMLTSRRLEYLRGVTARTVDQLTDAGLVKLGPVQDAPHFAYMTVWQRAQKNLQARTLTLTRKGRTGSA